MNKGIVFVVSGPSGSGKGEICKEIRKTIPDMPIAVSATSRAPREGEVDGKAYYFKTREEFEKLVKDGEILEYTIYNGNYYGTLKSECDKAINAGKDIILEIEVEGACNVKKLMPDDSCLIMLVAPDAKEQERRLRSRGTEDEEDVTTRLERAHDEIAMAGNYEYIVLNETGKQAECAENVLSIMKVEHLKYRSMRHITDNYFNA